MQHHNIVFHGIMKHIPWPVFERLVLEHGADEDDRAMTSKAHLIAMLYAQLSGARSLRDIETNLKSHAGKLYHLGGEAISRSALSTANQSRPVEVFSGLLSSLMNQLQRGYRRKIGDCVRLIDSTTVKLSRLSTWAAFSDEFCAAKAHIMFDPDAEQPVYLIVTAANVNDITAAKQMPIQAGATYVFDLGYYDYAWWARLDEQECRIITRLKTNTPFEVVEERSVPMSKLVRELHVRIDNGKVLRLFSNDLTASAEEIAALYKRRWAIELFFRWVKQTLKIGHFFGTSENAVRIQIAVALIAFVLLRLAHEANNIVKSLLAFSRLISTNLMQRRQISELLHIPPPPSGSEQVVFDFGPHTTRVAQRRRAIRAAQPMRQAA